MIKTAFITGATSGIGYATAVTLAKQGYRIIATGRREKRLKQLAEELHGITTVLPLLFDVTDKEAVFNSINTLPKEWDSIDVLVNNAGNAHGLAPIQEGSLEDWEAMLDINVKGLLYVSKAIIPKMIEKQKGHIVNIGSIAGKEVYANGNVYCASKHAVDAINASMRIDLLKENIKVSQVAPGLVETEFSIVRFKGDAERSKQVYTGYDALQAEDVADLISFIVTRPAHVNIADTLILPSAQGASTLLHKNS